VSAGVRRPWGRPSWRRCLASIAGAAVLLSPAASFAQSATSHGEVVTGVTAAPIQSVEIERQDVFDVAVELAWYQRLMNALHVKTKDNVIRRELLLQPGEPYDSARAAETARNLRKLLVFRDVRVDSSSSDSGLRARVVTGDAFTLKPFLSYKSAGTQVTYGIGIVEQNLFGQLINVEAKFKHEPDRDTLRFAANAPRIIANKVGLQASYSKLTDGEQSTGSVGMPFFSLASRSLAQASGEKIAGRVLQFREGKPDPSDSLQRRFAIGRAQFGRALRAGDAGYLRLQLEGQVRRDDFMPEGDPTHFPHSVTVATGLFAEANTAEFVVTRNYRNIGPEEDVDLSTKLRAGAWVAPKQWGYERGGVGPSLEFLTGKSFGGGFTFLNARASSLFTSAGLDSGSFTVTGTTVVQPTPRQSGVLFIGGGGQRNPYPGEEFDLGLVRGPRAFPQHAFTGDRFVFGSAEYRYIAIPDIAQLVAIGVAGFVDYGGAWYHNSPRRDGTDAGMGLRIGSSRFPSINGSARVDLAYRFANDVEKGGWVLVVGSGFVFEKGK